MRKLRHQQAFDVFPNRRQRDAIERHESNLGEYRAQQASVIERFATDITRFKRLKGID